MLISENHFLTWFYWFNLRPEPLSGRGQTSLKWFFLGLLIILVVNLLYLGWKKKDKIIAKVVEKLAYWSAAMIVFGLVWYWFGYEGVPVLSARFWWLIWLAVFLGWLVLIIKYLVKDLPRQIKQRQQQEKIRKYLPRKK